MIGHVCFLLGIQVGLTIVEADIDVEQTNSKWRFLLQTVEQEKLNYTQVSGLLYTLTYVLQLN